MKKLLSILLALIVLAALCATALAAEGTVTYDGEAQDFIFAPGSAESPTDLFAGLKNVLPGDVLTQQIEVKNIYLGTKKADIFLKALPADDDDVAFLSQLSLTVKQGSKTLFTGTADQTDGLTNWIRVATLEEGEHTVLDLQLNVPIELDNQFQGQMGTVTWVFKVNEITTGTTDPKTGDELQLWLLVALLVLSLGSITVLLVYRKRKAAASAAAPTPAYTNDDNGLE